MQFVERFNGLIAERGISTYKLSKDINVSDSLIGYWMRGMRQPAMGNLIRLADYFNVSLDYLVGRSNDRERR